MSAIRQLLLGNLPPTGRGVYARSQDVEWLARFDFVALNADRGDAGRKAIALVARGVQAWFYAMPSTWGPTDNHAIVVARFEALVDATGAAGCIADPEADGNRRWRDATAAQIESLRSAIADSIGRGYRWGVTCFADGIAGEWMRVLSTSGAWGSPQIYHNPGDLRWYAHWSDAFGARMAIPSVPVWHGSYPHAPDLAALPAFLAAMDAAPGAIGWTTDDTSEAWVAAYLAWEPWGNLAARVLLALRAYALTPIGIVVGVLVVAAILYLLVKAI